MILYKIENLVNNKCYFGITKCSLNKRWREHKCKSKKSNNHLYTSIRKYGIDNFSVTLIKEFDNEDEMYLSEVEYIKKYRSNNPKYGYNNSIGGEISSLCKKLSNETKLKISNYQKNRKRNKHSDETKKNISLAAKGRDMSKAVESSANKRRGKKSHNICSVSKYSLDSEFIEKFDSLTDAAKNVNGTASAFCAIKRGRLKTYKKFIWKFEN